MDNTALEAFPQPCLLIAARVLSKVTWDPCLLLLSLLIMEGDGNNSGRVKGKSFRTNGQKLPYPIIIEIESGNVTNRQHKRAPEVEESKPQKPMVQQIRKSRAIDSYVIDAHILPKDVAGEITVSMNDSEVLKVSEPFYLSLYGHAPRKPNLTPCRCNKKIFNENDLEVLFKGGIQINEISLTPLNSSNSCQDDSQSLDVGSIRMTASLSTQIPLLFKLISPILAKHLDYSTEALEEASQKREGIIEILKRVNSLLCQKTLVCEFSGIAEEKHQKINPSTLTSQIPTLSTLESVICNSSGGDSIPPQHSEICRCSAASRLFREVPEAQCTLSPESDTVSKICECSPPVLAQPILCSFTQEIAMSEEEVSSFSAAPSTLQMAHHVSMDSAHLLHRSPGLSERESKRFVKVCSPGPQVAGVKTKYFVNEARRYSPKYPRTGASQQTSTSQQSSEAGIISSLFAEKVKKSSRPFQQSVYYSNIFNQTCPPNAQLLECPNSCPYHSKSRLFQEEFAKFYPNKPQPSEEYPYRY